jgi:hypothetical protein
MKAAPLKWKDRVTEAEGDSWVADVSDAGVFEVLDRTGGGRTFNVWFEANLIGTRKTLAGAKALAQRHADRLVKALVGGAK